MTEQDARAAAAASGRELVARDPTRPIPFERSQRFCSLAFRISLFFAVRPDEVLTVDDIAEKFGVRREEVPDHMRRSIRRGIVQYVHRRGPGRVPLELEGVLPPITYAAGPWLLQFVGSLGERKAAREALAIDREDETRL